jgi:hypothetical protein
LADNGVRRSRYHVLAAKMHNHGIMDTMRDIPLQWLIIFLPLLLNMLS